jgi:chemotaxis protein methyltransferase CheR
MTLVLNDAVFRQLRDLIYEKSGIFIPDTKKYLIEKKIGPRVQERNLSSFEDYYAFLKFNPNGDESAKVFDAITTNETYFFREPLQFDVFVDNIVPAVTDRKAVKDIRIWSAASSTGEEPYTIALLMTEKKPAVRADIIASDISNEVLEAARKGVYGSYSVRNVPPPYLQKYFRSSGWAQELNGSVKSMVRFLNLNLIDDRKIKGTVRDIDVIFCRNVLIYFDDKAKQKAVSLLYDSLRPGGYLFVGSSESLHSVTRAFKPVTFNKVCVYQKV